MTQRSAKEVGARLINESGWLVELPWSNPTTYAALGGEPVSRWHLMTPPKRGQDYGFREFESPLSFVSDPSKALRFSRREDAEAFMRCFDKWLLNAVASEHAWMDALITPPAEDEQP